MLFPAIKVFRWGGVGWVSDFNVYSRSNSIELRLTWPWTGPDLELDNDHYNHQNNQNNSYNQKKTPLQLRNESFRSPKHLAVLVYLWLTCIIGRREVLSTFLQAGWSYIRRMQKSMIYHSRRYFRGVMVS